MAIDEETQRMMDWYSAPADQRNTDGTVNTSTPSTTPTNTEATTPSTVDTGSGNAATAIIAPTAKVDATPSKSGVDLPTWMGDMYKQDANGYFSTNPGNPNAQRFTSDGRPVATIGYENQQNGINYNGWGTPEQAQAIRDNMNNPAAETNLIKSWLDSGQLNHPYSNQPSGEMLSTTSTANSPVHDTLTKMGYGYPNNVNDPTFLNKSSQERLQAFKTGNADPYAELNRVKSVYGQTTDPTQQANIHSWADQVRQAAGISADDPFFGNGSAPTSQGSLNVNVNDKNTSQANVYNGTSYETADQLAKDLGLKLTVDPKTGIPSFNGTPIYTYNKDANGNVIVPTRMVANALGYTVDWDPKKGSVVITGGKNQSGDVPGTGKGDGTVTDTGKGTGTVTGTGTGGTNGSVVDQWSKFWNSQGATQGQQMPIQPQFTPDWQHYYDQAHSQIDPLYNSQYNKLMGKQNSDLTRMDESMNHRGIFTSGLAEAAANDLRAKTTNSVASLFNKQMSDIEKTAQTLYSQAYKQYSDGNTFALKNNQAQITNYMNQQKQVFSQWLGSQKLDLSQQQYALNAWDKMANVQLNQMKAMLPYQYQTANNAASNATSQANNAANNQTSMDKALLPYQSMTMYQQATTQEKQQMDAAINYFKQQGININSAKLMESIRHNQASESLSAAHLTTTIANNKQNFDEKVRMDNANIDKANAQLIDTAKRTQLDGLKSELNATAQRINSHVTQSQQVPQNLIDNYNTIKSSIEKIITPLGGE